MAAGWGVLGLQQQRGRGQQGQQQPATQLVLCSVSGQLLIAQQRGGSSYLAAARGILL